MSGQFQNEFNLRMHNLGFTREFVNTVVLPSWWQHDYFDIESTCARLKSYLTEVVAPWDAMTTYRDGAAVIAATALNRFNPHTKPPTYDVPMLSLARSTKAAPWYRRVSAHALDVSSPVYAVVRCHPDSYIACDDVHAWARAAYLQLPTDGCSADVREFYRRLSGVMTP